MRDREGKGVEKDLAQACALYSAAINGREDPDQKKGMSVERDKLGKELSADQREHADDLAQEWSSKENYDPGRVDLS